MEPHPLRLRSGQASTALRFASFRSELALSLSKECWLLLFLVGIAAVIAACLISQPPQSTPTPAPASPSFTPTPIGTQTLEPSPTSQPGADTLQALENEIVPENDLRDLALRLKGLSDIPLRVSDTPADHPLGTELTFNVLNVSSGSYFTVAAWLIDKSENVYFFAANDLAVDESGVRALMDNFQQKIYATDREFFGSEPNPGIDGDPHLYILYVRGLGGAGGTQNSADGYSHLAQPHSNEKEIFYVNADSVPLDSSYLLDVLAHEFQHMIHGYYDGNEDTWMNEGASALAELLNGFDTSGYANAFIADPDLQLTFSEQNFSEYGAGLLFLDYFLDRFGKDALKALVANRANGLRAVDEVLAEQGMTDSITGKPITAVDVFADWAAANYLGDPGVADGRYDYHNYPDAPTVAAPTDSFSACPVPASAYQASVHQFGADYYDITCTGQITIRFTGSQQTTVVPTQPHSGRYAFWGNRGDKVDTTLTREFDLTGLSSATLTYWAWWQIEDGYDFAYVEASTDGGKTWTTLKASSSTDANSTGNNYGWGYTGNSGGGATPVWAQEAVDLSAYVGKTILIRFEYVTDDAVNLSGLMIDDVAIPELNDTAGFETGEDGWDGAGFVRIDNVLPQTFVVQVIHRGHAGATTVQRLPLDVANRGSITLDVADGEKVTLVVSGVTPHTTEVASYEFVVEK